MSKGKSDNLLPGFLALLVIILASGLIRGLPEFSRPDTLSCKGKILVEVSGNITHPGVYGLAHPPDWTALLTRAGASRIQLESAPQLKDARLYSGASIHFSGEGVKVGLSIREMSAFHKITLGIPISLNKETPEGLTAVPGIGPNVARAIVLARDRQGDFRKLDDLLSIEGIGPRLFERVSRYFVL